MGGERRDQAHVIGEEAGPCFTAAHLGGLVALLPGPGRDVPGACSLAVIGAALQRLVRFACMVASTPSDLAEGAYKPDQEA